MMVRKLKYIKFFFKHHNYKLQVIHQYLPLFYICLISSFFKFFLLYVFFKKNYLKNRHFFKTYFRSIIQNNLKIRNSFISLKGVYFLSYGIAKLKQTRKNEKYIMYNLLKEFLKNMTIKFCRLIDIHYLSMSSKTLSNLNFITGHLRYFNSKYLKCNYFMVTSVLIRERRIFGYMRYKNYPRKKKFLARKFK